MAILALHGPLPLLFNTITASWAFTCLAMLCMQHAW